MVKISVVMTAYNEEKYIQEAIESVLSQDFKDFELIIVNDCSIDNTKEVVEALKKEDKRIKLINLEGNKGRAGAANEGIENFSGEYIAFFDADDIMCEKRLRKQAEFLDENKDISMVYSDMEILEKDGSIKLKEAIEFDKNPKEVLLEACKRKNLGEIWPYKLLDYKNEEKFIPGGSTMVRKNVFEKIKHDKNLRNSEDYDLWFQIIGKGFKIAKLPIIAFIYRKHSEQKSRSKENMKIAARYINKKLISGGYFR